LLAAANDLGPSWSEYRSLDALVFGRID
jgi:hypothetical protein